MQTTKRTIITLDDGDEIEVRYRRPAANDLYLTLQIAACPEQDGDETGSTQALKITTSAVTWARVERDAPAIADDQLLSDGEDITITLV